MKADTPTSFQTNDYASQAKELYGSTTEYAEFKKRSKDWTEEDEKAISGRFIELFKEAGTIRTMDPASDEAQDLVRRIQNFITENMYTCSDQILLQLGKAYSCGGDFTRNIDRWGGEGTGEFLEKAIRVYCNGRNS